MPSALFITIVFIILATIVGAFVRRRCRDKCLKDFSNNMVTLEEASGKRIWGQLRVENTGLELIYPKKRKDADGHDEASYILYKYEYANIGALVRFHDELGQEDRKRRQQELKRTYHPTLLRRLKRKMLNVFKTLRDSVLEVLNVLISQAKKATPAGAVLSSQDKYVTQMKQDLVGAVGTSFEPLLEKYIGHKVVLELTRADKVFEYCGVLKDYTAEFIEIMDVDYKTQQEKAPRKSDFVVLRKYGTVRHLGE